MAAYCRICYPNKKNEHVYVVCHNCGSHVCDAHYRWFTSSKKAYCDVCFPRPARQGAAQLADALAVLAFQRPDSPIAQLLAERIRSDKKLMESLSQSDDLLEVMALAVRRLEQIFTPFAFPIDDFSNEF